MRIQIVVVTRVPAMTCAKLCFSNLILDQAIKGEKRKRNKKYGESK